ncbi:MAG: hypothetical protein DRO90_01390 [Candidatus Altiarchaeales archaeon]|nr:MAG: hypothetical protein DRO95_01275 [Candidatus Altiarchaeales archaeon]RLI94849.1 MAG: hypothetical protein DRO90_01390 [Candidatus Altiarchaeales archaeon]RLI95136.1 MAG: hypothetical protein DRO94_01280 [Candidatus Altiarchaeales archaeon]HDO82869.1 DUF373 family protein [Candidatus Altiarchaeales archaeon]HEX55518.1 DUF373 family protein [Candidatus Altiarchaeales archaeon]
MERVKNIVLCVDRDDDIKRKTGINGPIIGIEKNLDVAKSLALVDPEDTDVNAIFSAVKIARELNTEVVTLTGDKNVGIVSDMEISRQLDEVIEKFKPESAILVTDGAEDEQIIPIIESRIKISSVRTVIVRQSQELERAYFKIIEFLREIENDPNLARLVFGIPGLVLILLAIGGAFGIMFLAINIVLAIIGIYLLIKGFGYEEEFFSKASEFINSFSMERISTLTYIISGITFIIALGYGYDEILIRRPDNYLYAVAAFIKGSMNLILIAVIIAIIGLIIDDYYARKYLNIRRDLILMAFAFLVATTIGSGANFFWMGQIGQEKVTDFIISIFLGIIIFLGVVKITEYMFIEEIQMRKNLMKKFSKKDVFDTEGNRIGRISRVILDGSELIGLKVGRKRISKEDIVSSDNEKVVVRIND